MNAPKINQTVLLENPESAQLNEALSALKPGFASCSGENRTYSDSRATKVTAINPMAPPGKGSNIKPTITAAKIAK
jgi:hypothetical protein